MVNNIEFQNKILENASKCTTIKEICLVNGISRRKLYYHLKIDKEFKKNFIYLMALNKINKIK